MDLGLKGKTAIVTGGSRGIGKAIARELASEGVSVAVCSRDENAAQAAAAEVSRRTGGKVIAFRTDTGNAEDIKRLVADTVCLLGSVDILVNNAARVGGTGGPDNFAELNELMITDDFNVKVLGYLRVAHEVAPHMERTGWGRIVNIDGMAARNAAGISGGLRNAAVMNFTKVMSEELGPKGITVNAVHPAVSLTESLQARLQATAERRGISIEEAQAEMAKNNAIRRLVTAEEIARVVAFLCSEHAACITGEAISTSGGNSRAVFY